MLLCPVKTARIRIHKIKLFLCPRHPDITKPPFFFQVVAVFAFTERIHMRKNFLFHSQHKHNRKFESFCAVKGHQSDAITSAIPCIKISHQAHAFDKSLQKPRFVGRIFLRRQPFKLSLLPFFFKLLNNRKKLMNILKADLRFHRMFQFQRF